uniref:LysR family transcriptional regulator n=1 Tax=Schistocephalus solidus TaxID=70667 RepID=A0A183TMM5_SCHSO
LSSQAYASRWRRPECRVRILTPVYIDHSGSAQHLKSRHADDLAMPYARTGGRDLVECFRGGGATTGESRLTRLRASPAWHVIAPARRWDRPAITTLIGQICGLLNRYWSANILECGTHQTIKSKPTRPMPRLLSFCARVEA